MTTFESLLQLFPFEHYALKVSKPGPNSYPSLQRRDRRHHVRSSSSRKNAIHARVTYIWKRVGFRIERLPSTFIRLAQWAMITNSPHMENSENEVCDNASHAGTRGSTEANDTHFGQHITRRLLTCFPRDVA
jgi:hypothetical protein